MAILWIADVFIADRCSICGENREGMLVTRSGKYECRLARNCATPEACERDLMRGYDIKPANRAA